MKSIGAGKLQVDGKLTIKGKTSAISFPMTYTNSGAQQSFEVLPDQTFDLQHRRRRMERHQHGGR